MVSNAHHIRRFFATTVLVILAMVSGAQGLVTGTFTWIKGADTVNDLGSYGQLGIASPSNNPRARGSALTWTDTNGITWLYGGISFSEIRYGTYTLHDFWTYNPISNNWTWMAGPEQPGQNSDPVYGEQGVPSPLNDPGPRSGAFTWVGDDGKFWFYDALNSEIWNYNSSTSEWTWMNGKSSQPNGQLGVPSVFNTPGNREEPACWKAKDGKIWMLSGIGNSDDMWMYDPVNNTWTWIRGQSSNVPGAVYGTPRTEDPSNSPGPRKESFTWTDKQGNFWLMGGFLFDGDPRDLWRFNYDTRNWAWMKGAPSGNTPETIYGTKGVEDETNLPGERGRGITWVDQQNNLWIFGGVEYHSTLDELWRFNTSTLNWTWVRGADEPDSYGTPGVSAPENLPPRRSLASVWTDKSGTTFIMGGIYVPRVGPFLCYNDLWQFTSNDDIILAASPLTFSAQRQGSNALLKWKFEGEKEIKGYTVQKQEVNGQSFNNIAYVAAKTITGQQPVYQFTDLNLSGVATYYRLQLLHSNGSISYSETRMVPGLDHNPITVYPNPSAGQVINVQFNDGALRNISLISLNGVIIKHWFNYSSILLQLNNLQPGTYLLRVQNQTNHLIETKKIVVIK